MIAVNVTANWRLIRSLDPLLRQSDAGRALFISRALRPLQPFWGVYSVSKAALEQLVKIYAAENTLTKIRVDVINPGPLRTELRAQGYARRGPHEASPPDVLAPRSSDALARFRANRRAVRFSDKQLRPLQSRV